MKVKAGWRSVAITSNGDVVGVFEYEDGDFEISYVNAPDDESSEGPVRFPKQDIHKLVQMIQGAARSLDSEEDDDE